MALYIKVKCPKADLFMYLATCIRATICGHRADNTAEAALFAGGTISRRPVGAACTVALPVICMVIHDAQMGRLVYKMARRAGRKYFTRTLES
ncbi:hypothetical protein RCIX1742 [Methanocella arvoryzae MRE50]|uniref:Uncharacterized protein n=1 Tax=Methanocella arvoryzae (strain DSM 22066 / NBRC 105507 / MRE50) TaxID=351160 RepID=Q0W3U1_METAR|nr:hypothetical protein RCIX1742 [Methanocella arvoryzae MRE50]